MKIVKLTIKNFRSISNCEFFPKQHNLLIGPNNVGKTAILESINILLNPESRYRSHLIDENDFHCRRYLNSDCEDLHENQQETQNPRIQIEAVLAPVDDPEDRDLFRKALVPWEPGRRQVKEACEEDEDPYEGGECIPAVRIAFEAVYDQEEDEFRWATFFRQHSHISWEPENSTDIYYVNRNQKRRIGFLIYRDIRALQKPITLEPASLLTRVLSSQGASPKNFEAAFDQTVGSLEHLKQGSAFEKVIADLQAECESYLPLSPIGNVSFDVDLTDRTRVQFKQNAQLYVDGNTRLPIQKMGAGSRSLIMLSLLTYIARKRGRGILALEEPETFLFPHAQKRVVDEIRNIATQTFTTTHSPYVLERFGPDTLARVTQDHDGKVIVHHIDETVDPKLFRRHLRKQLAEALLSRAVVVAEENSVCRWLGGLSDTLAGKIINSTSLTSFDLLGVAAISADGIGTIVPIAEFLESAGLPVLLCFDKDDSVEKLQQWKAAKKPFVELPYKGLEDLLVNELPSALLKMFITKPDSAHSKPIGESNYDALDEQQQNAIAKEFLIKNKGSIPFHEWMVSQVDENSAPGSFIKVLVEATALITPKKASSETPQQT